MTRDLVSNRLFSFPTLPSIWEDDDFTLLPQSQGGLSISEDDSKVYIEAALPGIDSENIDITFHDGYVWVRGEKKEKEEDKKRKYYRQSAKSFSYRVAVPGDVDLNTEPEAEFDNGVMTITFAKSPKSQPKKIAVKKKQ